MTKYNEQAKKFYTDFANLPDSLELPKELVHYAKALYKYHGLNDR